MSAVGSRDGREIVRALEDLRAKTALDRDAEGRYFLKGEVTAIRRIDASNDWRSMIAHVLNDAR